MQERRVSESGYLKTSLMEIASAVERMVLLVDPNFEKDETNDAENLRIHDRLIPNPFSLKTVNNFNSSPPFGLFDLIPPLHWLRLAWARRLQVIWRLPLIQWWLCRIFTNCSVESRGCPCIYSQSAAFHENQNGWRKEYYDLWFILEGRGANRGSVLQARCKCKGGRDGGCMHIAAAMYAVDW